jgi:hypothetical protein
MVGCLSRIGVDDAALAQSAGERVVRVVPTDGRRMSKRAASCLRQSETHGCSGMSRFTAGSLCSGSLTLRKTLKRSPERSTYFAYALRNRLLMDRVGRHDR